MGVINMDKISDGSIFARATKKLNEKDERIMDILAKRRMIFSPARYSYPIITIDIGTDSTDVEVAKVTYIAIKTPTKEVIIAEPDEKHTIMSALNILFEYRNGTLLGYNHINFDLCILRKRMSFHNINFPLYFKQVLDLRQFLCDGNIFMKGKLEEFASAFNFRELNNGWCKSNYTLLWQDENIESLRTFLLFDIRATYLIFLYLKGEYDQENNSLRDVCQPKIRESRKGAQWQTTIQMQELQS
jgi:hypothetical protein